MAAPKGNQYGKGRHTGRPLKFKSVGELEEKISAYFADCNPHIETKIMPTPVMIRGRGSSKTFWTPKKTDIPDEWRMHEIKYITKQTPYTVTGLAVWLGTDRELLLNYGKREGYSEIIGRAKTLIEAFWEQALWNEKVSSSGVIFNLKNNWGWKDKVEVSAPEIETGYEHLTDEEIHTKLNELRRQNGIPQSCDKALARV